MGVFDYVALDARRRETRGQVEAADRREAVRALRDSGIYVVSLHEVQAAGDGADHSGWFHPQRYLGVGAGDLVFLFRQCELMLGAGHTLVQTLDANREMTLKLKLKNALGRMSDSIRGGGSLAAAMDAEGRLFPPLAPRLIEVGQRTGEVDAIFGRLADDLEAGQDLKRQLIAALTYPSIVLLAAVGVSVALVGWVIPRFALFLTARKVALPPVTQFLLDLSAWFEDWGALAGGATLVALVAILAAYTTAAGKRVIDGVLLRLPVIGAVIRSANLAQATMTLSMQLKSGIALREGLAITAKVMGNRVLAEVFERAAERILGGQSLSEALRVRALPALVQHMAAIGEQSGELEGTMAALGAFYRKDLNARVKLLAAWVEPLLILFVGGLVGTVYLAFFQAALKASTG